MNAVTRLLERRALRRRMMTREETVRHGFKVGDRVRTEHHGLGAVWWVDVNAPMEILVELDEPPFGVWLLQFAPYQLERVD